MVSTSILAVLVLCLAPVLVCGNYGLLKAARAVTPMSIMEEVEAEFDFQLDQMDAFLDRKREIEASVTRLPEHLDSFVRSVVGTGSTRGEAPFNMMYDASAEMNAHTQRRQLESNDPYNNPDDKYEQSSNVKNGAAISGTDFDPTAAYIQAVLVKPILLFCLGFVSLFFFNIALCCRCCCKCCRCKPNDHHTEKGHEMDSHDTRERYINHQKQMVLLIEVTLIFAVLLADTLCFYGYTYLQEGAAKLNEAFDLLLKIFENVKTSCVALQYADVPELTNAKDNAKVSCSNGANALSYLDDLCVNLATTSKTLTDGVEDLLTFIKFGKTYVNDFLAANLRPFVFVIWSLAALSTFFFIAFRVCHNECGTKLAIFWGELTFFIILLVNVPLMIFTQVIGDFCVQPTANTLNALTKGSDLRNMVYFYSHCNGTDTIRENLLAVNDTFAEVANTTNYLQHPLICDTDPNVAQISSNITQAGVRFGQISEYIQCSNFQAVWFKLMNEAFCGGFYSGIYSLWVSQFITSFFLFFLIICASVSYQYFKPNSQIVVDNEQVEGAETQKYAQAEPVGGGFEDSQKPGAGEYEFGEKVDGGGGGGELEMTEQAPLQAEDGDDII